MRLIVFFLVAIRFRSVILLDFAVSIQRLRTSEGHLDGRRRSHCDMGLAGAIAFTGILGAGIKTLY